MSKTSDVENQFERQPTGSNFALIGHAPSSGSGKRQRIIKFTLITVFILLLLSSIGLISVSLFRKNTNSGEGGNAIEINAADPFIDGEPFLNKFFDGRVPYATGKVIHITDERGHIFTGIRMNNGHVRFQEKDYIYDERASRIYAADGDVRFKVIDE